MVTTHFEEKETKNIIIMLKASREDVILALGLLTLGKRIHPTYHKKLLDAMEIANKVALTTTRNGSRQTWAPGMDDNVEMQRVYEDISQVKKSYRLEKLASSIKRREKHQNIHKYKKKK